MTLDKNDNSISNVTDSAVIVAPYLAAVATLCKTKHELESCLLSTICKCVPSWHHIEPEVVEIQHLGGAMTNLIFALHKSSGKDCHVLVRVYGEGTDVFFSRKEETRMFQLLSEKHIGIQLLGQFANGRVETLIPGITYTNERMRQVDESRLIAKQVRVFHDLNLEIDRHPTYLTSIRKLVDTVGRKCLDSKFQQFVNYHQLKQDVEELEIFLNQVPSRLVLSHNDLQYGNIMKNEQGQAVLIDFEYTSYNPRGYDVGNHFCEWAYDYHKTINPHIGDFTKYPTKEEQRNFCRAYLAGKDGHDQDVSDDDIETLRLEANTYSLASHLFWALWGYIQASQSKIDFDFLAYGKCRYDAFKSRVTLNK
ncbi:unnamed protein product [Peronospora belbahrii]|uniref:Choline/ethanolamine kinase n=1 Tax=Peronospora belbahrii TaxID=622444 RepID=A0AAU9KL31_9STRA|nr:unnamed protein product [Peronospora belbahrii]